LKSFFIIRLLSAFCVSYLEHNQENEPNNHVDHGDNDISTVLLLIICVTLAYEQQTSVVRQKRGISHSKVSRYQEGRGAPPPQQHSSAPPRPIGMLQNLGKENTRTRTFGQGNEPANVQNGTVSQWIEMISAPLSRNLDRPINKDNHDTTNTGTGRTGPQIHDPTGDGDAEFLSRPAMDNPTSPKMIVVYCAVGLFLRVAYYQLRQL
jgi:hypothetical protein